MGEKKWYSLHVQSGFEDRVRINIQNTLSQEDLLGKLEETFIPAEEKVAFKVGGKEKEAVPLKGEPRLLEFE